MNYQDCKIEFEFDGSWRDIYVPDTDIQDWQKLIDFVHSGFYPYSCWIGGEEDNLQLRADAIFKAKSELTQFIQVQTGAVVLNCHFFTPDEIEFDLDPREIQSQVELNQVLQFMREIGRITNREVILTPENLKDFPIFKISSGSEDLQYIPFGPFR